ncbi:hypothetical protein E1B28_005887 [Marasmius oreades]|uniref:Nudix hydrolase domain-containing protein n=1 Tax=Marasmius oreades TaxID=181124 RepID=A0A9P7S4F9_9AGAR|nr:uncharacterized protein E1B28_005887 [Marasmius oreades]KAG7095100.1 hypothetical protein E1B28_005887 [Marasmius oreades]
MATSCYPTTTYPAGNFTFCAGSILFRRARVIQTADISSSTQTPRDPPKWKWQICLLYHCVKDEWLLPKGRKDAGESLEAAAIRETFEETGYPNTYLPITLPTRAPMPGTNQKDVVRIAGKCTSEPIAITVRDVSNVPFAWDSSATETTHSNLLSKLSLQVDRAKTRVPNAKVIHWYATVVQSQARLFVHPECLGPGTEPIPDFGLDELGDSEKQENTQTASESFDSQFFDVDAVDGGLGAVERLTFQGDQDIARLAVELVKGTYGD